MATTAALFQRLRQTLQVPSRQKRLREMQTGSNNHVVQTGSKVVKIAGSPHLEARAGCKRRRAASRTEATGPYVSPLHVSAAHSNSESDSISSYQLGFKHAGRHNCEPFGDNTLMDDIESRSSIASDDTLSGEIMSTINLQVIAVTGHSSAPSTMEISQTLTYAGQDQSPATAHARLAKSSRPSLRPGEMKFGLSTTVSNAPPGTSTNYCQGECSEAT